MPFDKPLAALAAMFMLTTTLAAAPLSPEFSPVFDGRTLGGWTPLGAAQWRVQGDEIVAGDGQGWLRLNTPFQDGRIKFRFRCAGACNTGVLLRAATRSGRTTGLYLPLVAGELGTVRQITLNDAGAITDRDEPKRVPVPPRPAPPPPAPGAPAPAPPPAPATLADGDWNYVTISIRGGDLSATLNGRAVSFGGAISDANSFGQLYLAAAPGLRIKELAFEDYVSRRIATGQTGTGFQTRQLDALFHGETAGIADLNQDGRPDILAGPLWFEGPTFRVSHEMDLPGVGNASAGYLGFAGTQVFDWTGDGWPDVLNQGINGGFPATLYVNPGRESRHWDKHVVVPTSGSEIFPSCDLFRDGRRQLITVVDGRAGYAAPGTDPTKPWTFRAVSEVGARRGQRPGPGQHGLGCGDVNKDGRPDVLSGNGWWEQPARVSDALWTFHSAPWDVYNTSALNGGGEMHVYDVNGDGRPDVISSLRAHGYGLAWFEQTADGGWTRHMIMNPPEEADGDTIPPFSELHSVQLADMDGDGLMDIVTGKRWWSHGDLFREEGFQAPAVLYWFKLSRQGGKVTYTPRLIHDRSGIGTNFAVGDVNGDRRPDVATSARFGTFLFLNELGRAPAGSTGREARR